MRVAAIIAAGGQGVRFGGGPKQLRTLGGRLVLEHSIDTFRRTPGIDRIVVVLPAAVVADPPAALAGGASPLTLVAGGARRRDSVAAGLAAAGGDADLVVIHDAARPLVSPSLIERTVAAAVEHGAAIAALPATDTVKRGEGGRVLGTLPRREIFLAQTPQAFRVGVLREALALEPDAGATDEAMLAELAGHHVHLVEGEARNLKITTPEDLEMAERLLAPSGVARTGVEGLRIGNGYDLHRLVEGRPLVLGGVHVPYERGLLGHSDADAVCHAITDALLGAAGAGDIGRHFPDTDPAWKGADSLTLLARAAAIVRDAGYVVVSIDTVVVAERPKLAPYVDGMRAKVAEAVGVEPARIGIKGKTNEGVDATGAGEAIAVHAVALLAR
jgi:2-C-methyl-D-erythritol 4-phosphate cytidylyltransferase/2-C-methyl-D-erythritol 2,4-cyclodiphosphate synthase